MEHRHAWRWCPGHITECVHERGVCGPGGEGARAESLPTRMRGAGETGLMSRRGAGRGLTGCDACDVAALCMPWGACRIGMHILGTHITECVHERGVCGAISSGMAHGCCNNEGL